MGSAATKVAAAVEESTIHSKNNSHTRPQISKATAEVVKLMFPVYYVEERQSADELALAKLKWNMILNNTSEFFDQNKGKSGFEQPNCMSMFYDTFYGRFFDVHPVCSVQTYVQWHLAVIMLCVLILQLAKPMFSAELKVQGKFLVRMMSLTLSTADQDDKFEETMVRLAEVHNDRGVKAIECKFSVTTFFSSWKRNVSMTAVSLYRWRRWGSIILHSASVPGT
jgi:hypothetical protein